MSCWALRVFVFLKHGTALNSLCPWAATGCLTPVSWGTPWRVHVCVWGSWCLHHGSWGSVVLPWCQQKAWLLIALDWPVRRQRAWEPGSKAAWVWVSLLELQGNDKVCGSWLQDPLGCACLWVRHLEIRGPGDSFCIDQVCKASCLRDKPSCVCARGLVDQHLLWSARPQVPAGGESKGWEQAVGQAVHLGPVTVLACVLYMFVCVFSTNGLLYSWAREGRWGCWRCSFVHT